MQEIVKRTHKADMVCCKCAHSDLKRDFCRVTARCIHAGAYADSCKFFLSRTDKKNVK